MNTTTQNFLKLALFGAALLLPAQASAQKPYTCTINPAICQKICGKPTCGNLTARDRDVVRLERASSSTLASAGKASTTRPYTCFNPAICIAVCGKKTC